MRPFYFASGAAPAPSRWKLQGPGVLVVVALHALLLVAALKSPWLAPGATAAAHQVRETWFQLMRSGPAGEGGATQATPRPLVPPRADVRPALPVAAADARESREGARAEVSHAGGEGASNGRPVEAALVPEHRPAVPASITQPPDAVPRSTAATAAIPSDASAVPGAPGAATVPAAPGGGNAVAGPAAGTPARPDSADRRPHVILLLTVDRGAATYSFPALSGDVVYRVERGDYPDIETAVAYHVIGQIRARFPVSVKWDSHFKHSIVKLSMLPEDEVATAAFLRQELFGRRD